jgi:hypothetical protein
MSVARRLAGALIICLAALFASAGPAMADASPVVDLVDRLVPAHDDLDAARDAFAGARAAAGDGSPAARAAARAYPGESDDYARRTAAVAVRSDGERALREAMAGSSRALSGDLRTYAAGAIDGAELDRRVAATRARSAERIAALVPAVAAEGGLDDTAGGRGLATGLAPVILLVMGVVGIGAITRRRSAARRSRTS